MPQIGSTFTQVFCLTNKDFADIQLVPIFFFVFLSVNTDALTDIQQRRSILKMPEETDLQGAAQALIRLKRTYRLNVTELSRGNLEGIMSQVQMTGNFQFQLQLFCNPFTVKKGG